MKKIIYLDKILLFSILNELVDTEQRYVCVSRPRRFGKSLLISTLEAYFLGKKELFEGLAIEKLEKDWFHPLYKR